MRIAGSMCGVAMGLLLAFGGPLTRGVLGSSPNVLFGTAIVVALLAGPWTLWHLRGSRAQLALLADADDLTKPWLGGGVFMVLVGSSVLIFGTMLRGGSSNDGDWVWNVVAILASLVLMVLGAAIDLVRRRRAADAEVSGAGLLGSPAGSGWATPANVAGLDAAQRRAYVMRGIKLIGLGVGILVLGALGSIVASALLSVVGMAVVGVGALVAGLVTILRGLYFVFLRGFIR